MAPNSSRKHQASKEVNAPLLDFHSVRNKLGDEEFRLWLRDIPIEILKQLIRKEDYDPTRKTTRWTEVDRLAEFIANSMRDRSARGSSFLGKPAKDK